MFDLPQIRWWRINHDASYTPLHDHTLYVSTNHWNRSIPKHSYKHHHSNNERHSSSSMAVHFAPSQTTHPGLPYNHQKKIDVWRIIHDIILITPLLGHCIHLDLRKRNKQSYKSQDNSLRNFLRIGIISNDCNWCLEILHSEV